MLIIIITIIIIIIIIAISYIYHIISENKTPKHNSQEQVLMSTADHT